MSRLADPDGLLLFNGRDAEGRPACVRIVGCRIVDPQPRAGDRQINLGGDRLLPGLINAHDHLQLNGLPRLKYRERYENAAQWSADIGPRLQQDPQLRAYRTVPLPQRLLIGGLKNLLSGVTTVAHHDPGDPALAEPGFPVRVPAGHGWSHSLALDGAAALRQAESSTPRDRPWIVHAAEGIDAAAGAEFDRLEALGCIRPHTVLVHGLGLGAEQQQRLAQSGASLVWCPGSNLHLFGRTLDVESMGRLPRLALGSDSRISGECDLLAELALARALSRWDEPRLEALVTTAPAAMLNLHDRGALLPGRLADVLVLPAALPLSRARRSDVRLVLVGGRPLYADPDMAAGFAAGAQLAPVEVDGQAKMLARPLVMALRGALLKERGLTVSSRVLEPLS